MDSGSIAIVQSLVFQGVGVRGGGGCLGVWKKFVRAFTL